MLSWLNRRVPNGTHGGVRGRGSITSSYSIVLENIVIADSTILTRKNVNTQGNIEGGVHRGDLFVDDGSIYVMSITTEWQAECS